MLSALIAITFAFAPSDGLPVRPPKDVGMSAERLSSIDRVVKRGVTAGGYPGAAVIVGRRGYAAYEKGFGHLGWTSDSPAVNPERSIYDLASLTKVVGTTTAAMILYDEGRLDLDAPVSRYLPAFSGGKKDLVTVRQLLTHESGLPAGRTLWRLAHSPTEAKKIVLSTPLACSPGKCQVYSDLGADVLGWVIESIAGQGLDAFLQERVFGPLGMNDTHFRPDAALRPRIAPTEVSPPRGYPIQGEVHDENAWALGGVAGHAGLFSTAADLSLFAQMMLNMGEYQGIRIVSDSTVALFTRRTAGTRALGWDTADGEGSSGVYMSERAYGHTGYTGTSLWIDPDRDMFVILLTNRVHAPKARRPAKVIADVRADLADVAAAAVVDVDMVVDMPRTFRADLEEGWNRTVRRARRPSTTTKKKKSTSSASKTSRSGSAKSGSAKSGSAKSGSAKSGSAKSGSAKSGSAKSGSAKSGAAAAKKRASHNGSGSAVTSSKARKPAGSGAAA